MRCHWRDYCGVRFFVISVILYEICTETVSVGTSRKATSRHGGESILFPCVSIFIMSSIIEWHLSPHHHWQHQLPIYRHQRQKVNRKTNSSFKGYILGSSMQLSSKGQCPRTKVTITKDNLFWSVISFLLFYWRIIIVTLWWTCVRIILDNDHWFSW